MDCTHNHTGGFSLFVRTKVLPREEINRQAEVYRNFWNKDGTPKARSRRAPEDKYTLAYHQAKIKDKQIKEKFQQIRDKIKVTYPNLTEEYTNKRISYWDNSNQCLFTIEPRHSNLWLGVRGEKKVDGVKQYIDSNKTFLKITDKVNFENTWTQIIQK